MFPEDYYRFESLDTLLERKSRYKPYKEAIQKLAKELSKISGEKNTTPNWHFDNGFEVLERSKYLQFLYRRKIYNDKNFFDTDTKREIFVVISMDYCKYDWPGDTKGDGWLEYLRYFASDDLQGARQRFDRESSPSYSPTSPSYDPNYPTYVERSPLPSYTARTPSVAPSPSPVNPPTSDSTENQLPSTHPDVDVFEIKNEKGTYIYKDFVQYKESIQELAVEFERMYYNDDDGNSIGDEKKKSLYLEIKTFKDGLTFKPKQQKKYENYSPIDQWKLMSMDFILKEKDSEKRQEWMTVLESLSASEEDMIDIVFGKNDKTDDIEAVRNDLELDVRTDNVTDVAVGKSYNSLQFSSKPFKRKLTSPENETQLVIFQRIQEQVLDRASKIMKIQSQKTENHVQTSSQSPKQIDNSGRSQTQESTEVDDTESAQTQETRKRVREDDINDMSRKKVKMPLLQRDWTRWTSYEVKLKTLTLYIAKLIHMAIPDGIIHGVLIQDQNTYTVYCSVLQSLSNDIVMKQLRDDFRNPDHQDLALVLDAIDSDVSYNGNFENWTKYLNNIRQTIREQISKIKEAVEIAKTSVVHSDSLVGVDADASPTLKIHTLTRRLEALQDW
jgi:hypothetical protein